MTLPDRERDLFARLFMGQFANPYGNPRMAKADVLYQLGREAWGGAIVEFGTYHGCGAIALACGSRDGNGCPVYTIDDYPQERYGWAGERYCSEDEATFWQNVELAQVKVNLIKKSVSGAIKGWNQPVSLIFWDTAGDEMLADFKAWSPYMIPGALFVMHDTGDKRFKSPEVINYAVNNGWELGPVFHGAYIVTLRKSKR